MRLAALLALSLAWAACAGGPADSPAEAADAVPESASFTVVLDSLRVDLPNRAFRVAVAVPQVQRKAGTDRAPGVQAANAVLRDSVRSLADDLRPEPPPRFADPTAVAAVGGPTYLHLSDAVVSALVTVTVSVADAPETRVLLPLTVDLETGAPIAPADLFAPGTPWADTVAAHVGRHVEQRLRGREPFYPGGLDAVRAGRVSLTVGPSGVIAHVPPGQLSSAPDVFHVAVPFEAVAPFATPALRRAMGGDLASAPSLDRTLADD